MKNDLSVYKKRLKDILSRYSVEIDTRKNPPVLRCPGPGHIDNDPSAVLYGERVWCPVCNQGWDIFDLVGIYESVTDFKDKLKYVKRALGEPEEPARKTKPAKKPPKPKPVALELQKSRDIYTKEIFDKLGSQWGNVVTAWPYLDETGHVSIIDVRFEDKAKKKAVITFWYDGQNVRSAGYPTCLYNLDKILSDKPNPFSKWPILIVEGAKSAKAADAIPGFISTTWNGGGKKAKLAPWKKLKDRKIYIYPDDDQHTDKQGKKKPWYAQEGYQAALEIKKALPQANIIRPLQKAREAKEDGADIVEALQVSNPVDLAKYILQAVPIEPPSLEEVNRDKNGNAPFTILGTSDGGTGFFIGYHHRLLEYTISSLTKAQLLTIAPLEWWDQEFGHKNKIDWDTAHDFIVSLVGALDFDVGMIRGRGAWRERDGSVCYHDGRKTTGIKHKKRLYVRKTRKDIGINEKPVNNQITIDIAETVSRMSFESQADVIRFLGWIVLAPFAGALPWRPAGLITGASGSGKTTVIEQVAKPVSMPLYFSGGATSAAGIYQTVKNDACAIIVEELEGDSIKNKGQREDIFTLMRISTSNEAPRGVKGTRGGHSISYEMRSMFMFAAISPEIEHVADDNRIFRINMAEPRSEEWPEIRDRLKELITEENCKRIRALAWNKLERITELAGILMDIIQDVTKKDIRYSLAEGMLLAAYYVVWQGMESLEKQEAYEALQRFYEIQPPEDRRDETQEIIDRLLDEMIWIDKPRRDVISLREILINIYGEQREINSTEKSGGYAREISRDKLAYLKDQAGRHGLGIDAEGNLMIALSHHEIMRITGKGRGYKHQLYRHRGVLEKSRVVWMSGKSRRCVVIKGILDIKKEE